MCKARQLNFMAFIGIGLVCGGLGAGAGTAYAQPDPAPLAQAQAQPIPWRTVVDRKAIAWSPSTRTFVWVRTYFEAENGPSLSVQQADTMGQIKVDHKVWEPGDEERPDLAVRWLEENFGKGDLQLVLVQNWDGRRPYALPPGQGELAWTKGAVVWKGLPPTKPVAVGKVKPASKKHRSSVNGVAWGFAPNLLVLSIGQDPGNAAGYNQVDEFQIFTMPSPPAAPVVR